MGGRVQILADRPLTRAEITARYRAAHRDLVLAKQAAYRAAHPDKMRTARLRWNKANPEKVAAHSRRRALKAKYGITIEQYDAILASQGGLCAICGTDKAHGFNDTFHVDHDHLTGRIRGLLCFACNRRLGVFEFPKAPIYYSYLARTS